jgi:uncharacterized protein
LKKQYWYVIIIYIIMQLSGVVGIPLLVALGVGGTNETVRQFQIASGYWVVCSFLIAFLFILWILRDDMKESRLSRDRSSLSESVSWAFIGVFLALAVQIIAVNIEIHLFGIEPGSENTRHIIEMVKVIPILVIVTSIIGPVLEEIIFRKIIFGTLYQKTNFWIAGLISSVAFAIVHMEPEHILLYSAMGLTFAFLYVKTKRILVPIFAHVAMNTFVVLIQTLFAENIEEWQRKAEQIQTIIGGF